MAGIVLRFYGQDGARINVIKYVNQQKVKCTQLDIEGNSSKRFIEISLVVSVFYHKQAKKQITNKQTNTHTHTRTHTQSGTLIDRQLDDLYPMITIHSFNQWLNVNLPEQKYVYCIVLPGATLPVRAPQQRRGDGPALTHRHSPPWSLWHCDVGPALDTRVPL